MPDLAIVLIVILVLVLLWRGPKTLPQLGEALGRGVKEARTAAQGDDEPARPERPDTSAMPRTPPTQPTTEDDRRV